MRVQSINWLSFVAFNAEKNIQKQFEELCRQLFLEDFNRKIVNINIYITVQIILVLNQNLFFMRRSKFMLAIKLSIFKIQ